MSNSPHPCPPASLPVETATLLGQSVARRWKCQRQTGATLVEFILVAMPLLLVGMLIIETAQWQIVRQIAYVALLDAARAGATQERRPDAIEHAFTKAFLPRFARPDDRASAEQQRTWDRIRQLSKLPAWQIEILQPGTTETLHVRLTYLHEPLAPYTRALLRLGAKTFNATTNNGCVDRAWAFGLVPIRMELRIDMHSQPIKWQTLPHTRGDHVVHGAQHCG